MRQNIRRNALGIVVVLLTSTLLGLVLPEFSPSLALTNLRMVFVMLVAFSLGGFVAQRGFLVPALICAFLIWSTAVMIVVDAAWPIHESAWPVIVGNLPTLGIVIPSAVVGALAGMRYYVWRVENREAAT